MPQSWFYDLVTDEVRALMENSLAVLREAGVETVEVSVPDMQRLTDLSNVVFTSEAAALHEPWLTGRPHDYQAQVRRRYEPGLRMPATEYVKALRARAGMRREFTDAVFAEADVLHTPAMPFPVPTRAETDVAAGDAMADMIAGISQCTRPTNYLGTPALVVPCGFTENGLPAAFQLMGPLFADETLFRIGHAYQRETDWHTRAPAF